MNSIAQIFFDQRLRVYRGDVRGLLRRKAILLAARLVKRTDPSVRFAVGDRSLTVPFSHELPRIWIAHPDYSYNLARLTESYVSKYPDATMVDVGANVGDSVAIVRTASDLPILCVEGDEAYLHYLEANTSDDPNVEIAPYYLGADDADTPAKVVSVGGTAHLEAAAGDSQVVSMRRLESVISTHPRFGAMRLMKIDTDGYEAKILEASSQILGSLHPGLFFEYDPHFLQLQGDDGLALFAYLKSLGYAGVVAWDNTGTLLLSTDLGDSLLLAQLHFYYSGRGSSSYLDLAVFHSNDADIFESFVASEMGHRLNLLGESGPVRLPEDWPRR